MMDLNHQRLLEMMEDVTADQLDYSPDMDTIETIGSLLEHIAAVNWSWVLEDIDGQEMDYERFKYGFALRSSNKIGQQIGKPKQYYLDKIEEVRDEILPRLRQFSDDDLQQEFIADEVVNFTLEWLFFHLINHEAMHIGQISLLKRLYRINNQ